MGLRGTNLCVVGNSLITLTTPKLSCPPGMERLVPGPPQIPKSTHAQVPYTTRYRPMHTLNLLPCPTPKAGQNTTRID